METLHTATREPAAPSEYPLPAEARQTEWLDIVRETEFTSEIEFTPEEITLAEKPAQNRTWPESNPDGTVSEAQYNGRLAWRAGNAEHALDTIRANITTEADAQEWLVLKLYAIELQSSAYYDGKSLEINHFADTVMAFVMRHDFRVGAYEAVCNK